MKLTGGEGGIVAEADAGGEKYKRPSWDEYFIGVMEAISKRGTCDRGRSGCVIAKNKQMISAGYVGSAAGDDHCDDVGHLYQKRYNSDGSFSEHCVRTVHAEQNAICQAAKNGISVDGATMYCKMTPCPVCAKMIANCGIKRVVCQKRYHDGAEAERVFRRSGIALVHQSEEEESYGNKGTHVSSLTKVNAQKAVENKLKIKKLNPKAIVPNFARDGDAGLDLYSVDSLNIAPGERVKVATGIAMEIPEGFVGLAWDRTGVSFKKGLKIIGGVVDSSYRGEIFALMANISDKPVEILAGEKVAQLVIQPFSRPEIELSDELSETERGEQMFGSSDLKPITKDDLAKALKIDSIKEKDGESQSDRW